MIASPETFSYLTPDGDDFTVKMFGKKKGKKKKVAKRSLSNKRV
jgi:hypothetical protein